MKMKSILCLFLACFSLSIIAQDEAVVTQEIVTTTTNSVSQTPSSKKPKLWIGPKFGLDIVSNTQDLNSVTDQLKGNYQFGVLLQYGRTIYIQPEVYYASYKVSETTSNNYIKVPLMLGLRFLNLGLFSLHAMGGPSYSFKLDDTDQLTGTKGFSWQVGAGIDVLGFITADLRYTLRNNLSLADQISQFSTNPNALNLTVGLKFR